MVIFVTCHFFIFKIQQNSHKNNFKIYLSKNLSQLEKIDISINELYTDSKNIEWLDDNKEVLINNSIYDVIYVKKSGKVVSLYVVNDDKEKKLMDNYDKLASFFTSNTSNSSKSDLIKDFLSLKFLPNSNNKIVDLKSFTLSSYNVFCLGNIPNVFLSQENPPPIQFS